jgi:hypothetical protein
MIFAPAVGAPTPPHVVALRVGFPARDYFATRPMRYKRRMRLPAVSAITVAGLLLLSLTTACGSSSTKSTTAVSGTTKSTTTTNGATNSDPKKMVLQLQDLPTGFQTAADSGYKSLTAAAKKSSNVSAAQYKAWGYVIGYEADYVRNGSLADLSSGGVGLVSSASVYRTSAGAEKSLASSAKVCSQSSFSELSVGAKIGNEVHLCVAVRKGGGVTAQVYTVMWRRGRIKATVLLGGLKGSASPEQAVALAKRQDSRIK